MGALGTRQGAGLAFLRVLPSDEAGCIEYSFGRWSTGYGRVRFEGRPQPAHVVAYRLHVGEIALGDEVCHNCGNRPCVTLGICALTATKRT